jgi:hypothetical protein
MPRPRMEKGLTGTEKYPFLGKKNENDIPRSCDLDGEEEIMEKKVRNSRRKILCGCIIFSFFDKFH